eukprot:9147943-Alexandrium_andersonii.AAC.1
MRTFVVGLPPWPANPGRGPGGGLFALLASSKYNDVVADITWVELLVDACLHGWPAGCLVAPKGHAAVRRPSVSMLARAFAALAKVMARDCLCEQQAA